MITILAVNQIQVNFNAGELHEDCLRQYFCLRLMHRSNRFIKPDYICIFDNQLSHHDELNQTRYKQLYLDLAQCPVVILTENTHFYISNEMKRVQVLEEVLLPFEFSCSGSSLSISAQPISAGIVTNNEAYQLVVLKESAISSIEESLKIPKGLEIIDQHNHTQYAYCGENVQMEKSIGMAKMSNLKGVCFTEHSGQLYSTENNPFSPKFFSRDVESIPAEETRMLQYRKEAFALRDSFVSVGIEIDANFEGELYIKNKDRDLDLEVGAVHFLDEEPNTLAFVEAFKKVTERLCSTGIHVLAHPFRIFRRSRTIIDSSLYPWLVDILKKNGVAAEVNFHTNDPDPEFIRLCIEQGVLISFGSDSHNLYELGEFYPHIKLLEQCRGTKALQDCLFLMERN